MQNTPTDQKPKMSLFTLAAPTIPPLVYEAMGSSPLLAKMKLNAFVACARAQGIATLRHRDRLPRHYEITPAPEGTPETTPQEWCAALKERAKDGTDYWKTHCAHGAALITGKPHSLKLRFDLPVNPPSGSAPSIWWECHFPAVHPNRKTANGVELPAVSFVCAAPAPFHSLDNSRARMVILTEWLRRLAVALDQPTPARWLTLEETRHADHKDASFTYLRTLPPGARLIPTFRPVSTPPPVLPCDPAQLPPSAPTVHADNPMADNPMADNPPALDTYGKLARDVFHVIFPEAGSPHHEIRPRNPQTATWFRTVETGEDPFDYVKPGCTVDVKTARECAKDVFRHLHHGAPQPPQPPTETPFDLADL